MAFTDAEKRDIRKYLGVPFGFYDLNTRLESMMVKVGDDATDAEEVSAWLVELAAIDAVIAAGATSIAGYGALKQVDEVEFYAPGESGSVAAGGAAERGRVLIQRLARSLGVQDYLPYGDYFKPSCSATGMLALG